MNEHWRFEDLGKMTGILVVGGITALVLLFGMSVAKPVPPATPASVLPKLIRIDDDRVFCYVVTGYQGISCYPKQID